MNGDGAVTSADAAIYNANINLYFYSYVHADWDLDGAATNADVQPMLDAFGVNDNFVSYRRSRYLTAEDLLWIGDADNSGTMTTSDINAMEQYLAGNSGYGT
jgi:hypothetical protein